MAATGNEAVKLSQLKQILSSISGGVSFDDIYPVGSIYLSMVDVNPSSLFGGTWKKLEGRFLLTSSSSYTAGETGGSNDAVVVSHSHDASTNSAGDHTHNGEAASNGSHTHTISGGSHTHSASTSNTGSHTHAYPRYSYRTNPTPQGWDTTSRFVVQSGGMSGSGGATSSSGSHNHSVTVSTSSSHSHTVGSNGSHSHTLDIDSAGSHTHTVSVDSEGVSGTNKNMPAYLVVNAWQRTA